MQALSPNLVTEVRQAKKKAMEGAAHNFSQKELTLREKEKGMYIFKLQVVNTTEPEWI